MASTRPKKSDHSTHASGRGSEAQSVDQGTTTGPAASENRPMTETGKVTSAALKARKRTKTGCLTCRKRRIKCGEERPTCKNCTKSKRECEGYIPRVVFKDPLGGNESFIGNAHGTLYGQQAYGNNDPTGMYGTMPAVSADAATFPVIAPRPSLDEGRSGFGSSVSVPQYMPEDPYVAATYPSQPYSVPASATSSHFPNSQISTAYSQGTEYPVSQAEALPVSAANVTRILQPIRDTQQSQLHTPQHDYNTGTQFPVSLSDLGRMAPAVDTPQDVVNYQINEQNQYYGLPRQATSLKDEPDNDWFDVESDDEENAATKHHLGSAPSSDLGLMLAMSANQNEVKLRSMNNFLNEPNILSTYNPPYTASPLMDPQTARVFCHFITATGPTLHVCERHPSNPTILFSGRPVPKSQRSLWSYTLPMLGLNHQGLLHAMLALSSLQISKLQQSSPTPSLRHYHYALRRVARALGDPKRRRQTATLAATLLLGYYEVTTAEHNKWNSHLSGARELIMDIPFARMARRTEAHRCQRDEIDAKMRQMHAYSNGYDHPALPPNESPGRGERQLDENLIGTIMGWTTRYNEYGQIVDDGDHASTPEKPLTPNEIDDFEIQCDLFWWYAKQDTYQSIISGNRLLLAYDRWGHCPPRAPIGRVDAVYGSMDHLYLMMARLADFSGKDLSRKKRASGECGKSPPAPPQTTPPSAGPTQQATPMYGMMPDPGPVRVPRGFDQAEHDTMYTAPPPSGFKPLDDAFTDAIAEWTAIAHAFEAYFDALGPSFAPLSPEHMTPLSTPFGPAIYYRSYSIACVLCLYYSGLMILQRVHPAMPPAAMAAIGAAAPKTAQHANTIGRICAGIQPVSNTAPLNPHHGAALMDVCMGLFNAGVQFRDAAQRGWTITKLRDVARLTGWQTSALIASGCERAWMRAAEMGKGPPYERTMNRTAKDDRIAGRSRDPRLMAQPAKDNNDRRFVHKNAGTRVYWAMGLLSVEEDMKELNFGEG